MTKKKTDNKTSEEKFISAGKVVTAIKSETFHFTVGLFCVIFGVYMLLAFSSFFFTGGNDQSILSHPNPGELLETGNRIQNYAGARGAQLSQFLINDCFGISAYLIIVFLIVTGMKLMKAYDFKLRKWFAGCSLLMIWLSIALGFMFEGTFQDSFLYPGGLHGYNISLWICSQIGASGLLLGLLITAILLGVFFSKSTIQMVRKLFHPSLPKRKKKMTDERAESVQSEASQAIKKERENKEESHTIQEETLSTTDDDTDKYTEPENGNYTDSKPNEIELTVDEQPANHPHTKDNEEEENLMLMQMGQEDLQPNQQLEEPSFEIDDNPVSYTHLTLPTNSLV